MGRKGLINFCTQWLLGEDFEAIPTNAQRLYLGLCPGVTLVVVRDTIVVPEIKLELLALQGKHLHHYTLSPVPMCL